MKDSYWLASAAIAAACLGCWCAASRAASATFTGIGDLPGGGFFSAADGISADGTTVVGFSYSSLGDGSEAHRWTESTGMIGLGYLPPEDLEEPTYLSGATAVSADGSIIVGWDTGSKDAFRWTESEGMVSLGDFPYPGTEDWPYDVSADGSVIAGESINFDGGATRWTQVSGMVPLEGIPTIGFSMATAVSGDGTVIVGGADMAESPDFEDLAFRAFRWTESGGVVSLGSIPGALGPSSTAHDVSFDGSVIVGVGSSAIPSSAEAFRWTDSSGMVGIGELPGGDDYSRALGVSADGSVIVGHSTTENGPEAFIWDETHGMRNLRELLINEHGLGDALAGWILNLYEMDISANGRVIVGTGINPDGNTEGWVVRFVVPEPSSSLLLLSGIGAMLMSRRSRGLSP